MGCPTPAGKNPAAAISVIGCAVCADQRAVRSDPVGGLPAGGSGTISQFDQNLSEPLTEARSDQRRSPGPSWSWYLQEVHPCRLGSASRQRIARGKGEHPHWISGILRAFGTSRTRRAHPCPPPQPCATTLGQLRRGPESAPLKRALADSTEGWRRRDLWSAIPRNAIRPPLPPLPHRPVPD